MDQSTKVCKGPLCEGKEKPISDFSKKKSQCKKCECHKVKENYQKNGRSYRNFKNNIKSESKCTECGCNDIRLLDFDHLGVKNITMAKSFSKTAIENELQHIQILCVWCHRLKSRGQFNKTIEEANKRFEILERPAKEEDGRICNGPLCNGRLQFRNKFYRPTRGKQCIACIAQISKNKRDENTTYVKDIKLKIGECELCKIKVEESNTCCFDFDHLRDKLENISVLAKTNRDTRKEIEEEVKKCRLLCCKCHRLVTAEQFNFVYSKPGPKVEDAQLQDI